jgi:5-methylcytosine-specific restriction endonuclease McrA
MAEWTATKLLTNRGAFFEVRMSASNRFPDSNSFPAELRRLHAQRNSSAATRRAKPARRPALTKSERDAVLKKTDSRCHVCGGLIEGNAWQADHVFAHSAGGIHTVGNYLPAHSLCNNYRWNYGTTEFQWILKLGVWLRTQIATETTIGRAACEAFCAHERRRQMRRKSF